MKDEEIKQAAIEEAQGYDDPDIRSVVYSSFRKGLNIGLKNRDEYAEEYAKALLKYMGFADIEPDQLVNDFKESLKK